MIHIQDLSFGYSRKHLLYKDLTLSLQPGNIYGLLGKNGAGKSTLLKSICGLLFPVKGSITVNGQVPGRRQPSFLQSIYIIPEEVYVPAVTTERYLHLFAPFYPHFSRQLFFQYLDQLEVERDARLNTLSFGQQKKFIIAFALACNTSVLLLDEPTNGLDIPSKARFRRLIASIMNEERIIFISTHQTRDLENLIDRVLVVDNGRLLLNAAISEVEQKLSFRTVAELPQNTRVLYHEETLRGIAIVAENTGSEGSLVNMEYLFNAVTAQPALISHLFTSQSLSHA